MPLVVRARTRHLDWQRAAVGARSCDGSARGAARVVRMGHEDANTQSRRVYDVTAEAFE